MAPLVPTNRRRVLYLVDAYPGPFGGTESQMRTLVRNLPPPWEAEVWALRPTPYLTADAFGCPIRVLEVRSLRSPRTLLAIPGLARAIRRRGFDLVHTFMNDASVLGPLLGRRAGLPVLVSRRDLGFWQTPRWLQLLRLTARLASGYLVNCEAVRAHTILTERVPPARVHVVHNGQPPERFARAAAPDLRARLGTPPGAPVVGCLANVKPLKRQDDLLAALARLRGGHPDLQAWFVGDDYSTGPSLLERARARGLETRVRRFRCEEDVVPVVKHFTLSVICSETEGLSNALLESLGCGLPVVATRVGGNPELVEHGVNGYLYEVGDVDALVAHVAVLLADPQQAAAMGAASRARFEQRFTLDRLVAETTAHYEAAVRGPGAPERPLRWEVLEDLPALERVVPAWEALLAAHQFFLGPDWVLTALAHAPGHARPHVLVARDEAGTLVGLLPLARLARGVLEVAGQRLGGDHLDVVALPGRADEVAEGALARLAATRWRRLRLRHLAEDGALRLAIHRAGRRLPFRERIGTVCPYLVCEGTFDDYVRQVPSKVFRRNLRRYPRRFLAEPSSAVERVLDPARAGEGIDRFLALHDRRFRQRGLRSSVTANLRAFHRALAVRTARHGRLALTFLRLGDRDVGCEYGFVSQGKMYAFQGGYDASAPVASPGLVLRALVLRDEVFGAGLVEYDFLDGDEEYKRAWTSQARRLFDVDVGRPHAPGRLAFLAGGLPFFARDVLRAGAPGEPRG